MIKCVFPRQANVCDACFTCCHLVFVRIRTAVHLVAYHALQTHCSYNNLRCVLLVCLFSFLHHIFSRFRLPDHAVRTILVKSLMIIVPMVSVHSTTGHRWDFNASFSALGRSVCTYTALYCGLHVYDTRRNVCRHFQLTKLTKYSVRDKRHPVIYPVFVCTR